MNKKARGLVIGGVAIGAIIWFIFRLWATSIVIDAIEPELEKTLNQLNENVVCPAEFNKILYEICITSKGEILVNGTLENLVSLKTDLGESCDIAKGKYNYKLICKLNNLNSIRILTLSENEAKTVLGAEKLISYSSSLAYLKKPIKTGFAIWKKVKYIPI